MLESVPQRHVGMLTSTLQLLSDFHEKLSRRITSDVHFLLEITAAVNLKSVPPTFPKGFETLLNSVGGSKISYHMALPFVGQHPQFV